MADLVQVPGEDGSAPPPPPPPNEGGAPPPPPPPSNDAPLERPTFIPEAAWTEEGYDAGKHFEVLRTERRPEDPDKYELPDIEGFDKEGAAQSPLMMALRKSAFDAGLDQDGFKAAVENYVSESVKIAEERATKERELLGENADQRTTAIGQWLGANLPRDQAQAIAASLNTAAAVIGFEKIMGSGARKLDNDPPAKGGRKSKAEIEAIMQSPAYMGRPHERDAAVIAEVDQWFKDEANAKK